ncbi:MAG: class IV adenylate cyclase [Bacteroidota bacterium]
MNEIEVKILEIDVEAIKAKLESVGAQVSFDDDMKATFYDFEDGSIRSAGGVLRLRQEGPTVILTRKELISKAEAKVMRELETAVEDPEALRNILLSLGLHPVKETHKHRIQYEWKNAHIVIDTYKGTLEAIPPFMEIEASDVPSLYQTVEILGYTQEDCKSWDTGDLIIHYGLT